MKKISLLLIGLIVFAGCVSETPSVSVDINVSNNDVEIGNSARQEGDINVKNGDVKIGGNAIILGSINIEKGNLDIGNSTTVEGKITLTEGEVVIGGNGQYKRDIKVEDGTFEAGNSNHFKDILVENGDIRIGGNNTIDGTLEAPLGLVEIENSNNISGDVISEDFKQGGNNVISGSYVPSVSEEDPYSEEQNNVYKGDFFSVNYPKDFTILPVSGGDYAAFQSPDKTVIFAVYSPLWTGEGTEIMMQENEIEISREVQKLGMPESELGKNAERTDTYMTFEPEDKSYTRSIVNTMYEKDESKTQRAFSYQYKDQESYDKHIDKYVAFKNSLVQYAD